MGTWEIKGTKLHMTSEKGEEFIADFSNPLNTLINVEATGGKIATRDANGVQTNLTVARYPGLLAAIHDAAEHDDPEGYQDNLEYKERHQ